MVQVMMVQVITGEETVREEHTAGQCALPWVVMMGGAERC